MNKEEKEYYQTLLDRGGGMICCGDYLGVMIGTNPFACPHGWVFIDIRGATVESIRNAKRGRDIKREEGITVEDISRAIEHQKIGRKTWPPKKDW